MELLNIAKENDVGEWFRLNVQPLASSKTARQFANQAGKYQELLHTLTGIPFTEFQILSIAILTVSCLVCMLLIWPPWHFRAVMAIALFFIPGYTGREAAVALATFSAATGFVGAICRWGSDLKDMMWIISGAAGAGGVAMTTAGILPPAYGLATVSFAAVILITGSMKGIASHSIGGATQVQKISGMAILVVLIATVATSWGKIFLSVKCAKYGSDPELFEMCLVKQHQTLRLELETHTAPPFNFIPKPPSMDGNTWIAATTGLAFLIATMVFPKLAKQCGAETYYQSINTANEKKAGKDPEKTPAEKAYTWIDMGYGALTVESSAFIVMSLFSAMMGGTWLTPGTVSCIMSVILSCTIYSLLGDNIYKSIARAHIALANKLIPTEPGTTVGHTPAISSREKFVGLLIVMSTIGTGFGVLGVTGYWPYAFTSALIIAVLQVFFRDKFMIGTYIAIGLISLMMGEYSFLIASIGCAVYAERMNGFQPKDAHAQSKVGLGDTPRYD